MLTKNMHIRKAKNKRDKKNNTSILLNEEDYLLNKTRKSKIQH